MSSDRYISSEQILFICQKIIFPTWFREAPARRVPCRGTGPLEALAVHKGAGSPPMKCHFLLQNISLRSAHRAVKLILGD